MYASWIVPPIEFFKVWMQVRNDFLTQRPIEWAHPHWVLNKTTQHKSALSFTIAVDLPCCRSFRACSTIVGAVTIYFPCQIIGHFPVRANTLARVSPERRESGLLFAYPSLRLPARRTQNKEKSWAVRCHGALLYCAKRLLVTSDLSR